MTNKELVSLLSIFRLSREKLVDDFIKEDVEIFSSMFEYENDIELMRLSIDKYFTSYINYHFQVSLKFENINKEFSHAMLKFLRNFGVQVRNTKLEKGKEFFFSIMHKKEKLLEEIINTGRIDSKRYNTLIYSYLKDKALFDRKINVVSEDK